MCLVAILKSARDGGLDHYQLSVLNSRCVDKEMLVRNNPSTPRCMWIASRHKEVDNINKLSDCVSRNAA